MANIAYVRDFNGTSDYIAFSEGALDGLGAFTWAAIVKPDAVTGNRAAFGLRGGAAGEWELALVQNGGTNSRAIAAYSVNLAGGAGSAGSTAETAADFIPAGVWVLIACTKATGIATPRWHVYNMESPGWTHTDDDQTLNSPDDSAGTRTFYIGCYGASAEFWSGEIAVAGVWDGTALTDGNLETLTDSITDWESLSPTSLFLLDQATVTTVPDRTGTCTYSSTTGTTVVTPTGLTFDDGTGGGTSLFPLLGVG